MRILIAMGWQTFSNLWRFSGGATLRHWLQLAGAGVLSVISGDSLVGQPRRWCSLTMWARTFSNLWRFSGGATFRLTWKHMAMPSFSNLWRFSGGATTKSISSFTSYPVLSVISGDSLVGQQAIRAAHCVRINSFSNLWRFSGGATTAAPRGRSCRCSFQ